MQGDLFDSILAEQKRISVAKIKGTHCKCCSQLCKQYKRKFNVGMAVVLIFLNKYPRHAFVEVEKMLHDRNLPYSFRADFHKTIFWGLIEAKEGEREDGNPNLGLYRITEKGRCFVRSEIAISEYALIYLDKCEGFSEKQIYIKDALKNRFDYNELMNS